MYILIYKNKHFFLDKTFLSVNAIETHAETKASDKISYQLCHLLINKNECLFIKRQFLECGCNGVLYRIKTKHYITLSGIAITS